MSDQKAELESPLPARTWGGAADVWAGGVAAQEQNFLILIDSKRPPETDESRQLPHVVVMGGGLLLPNQNPEGQRSKHSAKDASRSPAPTCV